jgi:hypothetical protein
LVQFKFERGSERRELICIAFVFFNRTGIRGALFAKPKGYFPKGCSEPEHLILYWRHLRDAGYRSISAESNKHPPKLHGYASGFWKGRWPLDREAFEPLGRAESPVHRPRLAAPAISRMRKAIAET